MAAGVLLYVSGHGFGHATRMAALAVALVERIGTERVCVRTEAPAWIFEQRAPGVRVSAAPVDAGVLQRNSLDLDLSATLDAHEALIDRWDAAVADEARFIEATGAGIVVADIPALAFAAAARVGVTAVGVANFSWDWILEAYVDTEPRWAPIVARYRDAYATAARLYRLPLHGDLSAFPRIHDVPLLVNRTTRPARQCRRSAGIPDDPDRRLVLVSFGGMGSGALDGAAPGDLDAYRFVGVGDEPPGFPGEWIGLPGPTAVLHEELICACDAVLGKPGFSTVAEVLAHGRRFLYLSRERFRENDVLERGLEEQACARAMPRDDFEHGRWRTHLDALFAQPARPPVTRCDGADTIADAILS